MKTWVRFILLPLLLLGLLTGCTYQIQEVRALKEPFVFNRVNLPDKKIYTPDPPGEIPEPYVISIYDVQALDRLRSVPHMEEYLQSFNAQLYEQVLYGQRRASLVTREGKGNENFLYRGRRIFEIRSTITEAHTGKGWLRYLVGWGAGDVKLQWEGTITDVQTGKVVLAFIVGERTNGDPNMAWNVKVFSDRYTMDKAIKKLLAKWYDEVRLIL